MKSRTNGTIIGHDFCQTERSLPLLCFLRGAVIGHSWVLVAHETGMTLPDYIVAVYELSPTSAEALFAGVCVCVNSSK